MPCFAHQLQLISLRFTALSIREQSALTKVKQIIARINGSKYLKNFLKRCVHAYHYSGHGRPLRSTLKGMFNTRWNSAHGSALKFMVAAMRAAADSTKTSAANRQLGNLWSEHKKLFRYIIEEKKYSFFESLENLEKLLRPIALALMKFQRQDLTLADVCDSYLTIYVKITNQREAETNT